jgi:cellulose synthase/poly-beta-1,6-N-acetylglucosamine synthase-like glycosyltransferase
MTRSYDVREEDARKDESHVLQLIPQPRRPIELPADESPLIYPHRLAAHIRNELRQNVRGKRPGILAAVGIAELGAIRARLGTRAEEVITSVFDELLTGDASFREEHCVVGDGGFLLSMPSVDLAAGRERLQQLSRLVAGTVIDVDGEHVRITPVIGYTSYSFADNADELHEQATTARDAAADHLDLLPVLFSPALISKPIPHIPNRDRLLDLVDRLRSPLQIAFTMALLISLPFIVYVAAWDRGFDLTIVTYPAVAIALATTAGALWLESFRAVGAIELPVAASDSCPAATAIVAAYLPNEAATILDTITNFLEQDYPGDLQVILAYNRPQHLPVEDTLAEMAAADPRLLLLRVEASTSKAQNVNAAIAHVRGEFVGVFDADHHPGPGSFQRAWRWLSHGHDIVQGHCVVRNGNASWVAKLVAVEFETIYAVSHPGRARLHGFGIFGGSNGYWRTESLRQIRMQGSMLTEDIDSSMRSLLDGFSIVSDPGLMSTELAPTTISALWNQRLRWAQGWTQTAMRHLRPSMRSRHLSIRQKIGAAFLLGWTQVVPWVTVQVLPILAFTAWRDGGFSHLDLLMPLFVLLTIFTFSVGVAQSVFAYILSDPSIRRHRWWFVLYAAHSMVWFGEFKNVVARVAQLKEFLGERQWRVTPRAVPKSADIVVSPRLERQPVQ